MNTDPLTKGGGQAFPVQHAVADANLSDFKLGWPGMTRRDYFAAHASDADTSLWIHRLSLSRTDMASREEAKFAYADAMLAASKEKS